MRPHFTQHLFRYQQRYTRRRDDEENPSHENRRTIARRARPPATLLGELQVQKLQELFWRWPGGFDLVRGVHSMFSATTEERAYFAPFAVFLAFLGLNELIGKLSEGTAGTWWWSEPHFWIFPLQTLVCGWMIARRWRFYNLRPPAQPVVAVIAGLVVLGLWLAPQLWLGFPSRTSGFDPTYFATSGAAFAVTVALRFLRLVVVVPIVEEIFWRGYLLRVLIDEPFIKVPVGAFSWLSFAIVTAGFCLKHQAADWPAAILAGALYNLVAYRTRSLSSCILAHAITNLLLGLYVMRTGQWGFW